MWLPGSTCHSRRSRPIHRVRHGRQHTQAEPSARLSALSRAARLKPASLPHLSYLSRFSTLHPFRFPGSEPKPMVCRPGCHPPRKGGYQRDRRPCYLPNVAAMAAISIPVCHSPCPGGGSARCAISAHCCSRPPESDCRPK